MLEQTSYAVFLADVVLHIQEELSHGVGVLAVPVPV